MFKKIKTMNIQLMQNINLLSILFISKLFFDFPILYSEIIIVFISIIIFEYSFKKIFKKENSLALNSSINTWVWILFFLKTSNPLLFILTAFISISSKYFIKYEWKHFLNPSNIWLVTVFLLFPNDVWLIWEQWDRNYILITYILLFWVIILARLKYLSITLSFLLVTIIWTYFFINPSIDALLFNVTNIAFILFALYMITDPSIVPKKINKYLYGWIIAYIFILIQYYIVNSYILLVSLTIITLLHPLIYKFKNKALYIILCILIIISSTINYNLSSNLNDNLEVYIPKNDNISIKIDENDIISQQNIDKIDFKFKENHIISSNNTNDNIFNFNKTEIYWISKKDRNTYDYYANLLYKSSISGAYFNNDEFVDFFTVTDKWLTIWLYDPNINDFDLHFIETYRVVDSINVFYRSIDYNFDWLYDIVTNNNKNLQFSVLLNIDWKWTFIEKKLDIFSEWLVWIGYADINNDHIMDFIVPQDCYFISVNNDNCKDNYLFLSNKDKYTRVNLDENVFDKEVILNWQTLTSFYWELNNKKQIYIWNDFSSPDLIYNVDWNNILLDKNMKNYIPATSFQTMSCDSGDINNDWRYDLFCTDMLYQNNIHNKKLDREQCNEFDNVEDFLRCYIYAEVAKAVNDNKLQGCIDLKEDINSYITEKKATISTHLYEILWFEIWLCINQVIMNTAEKTLNKEICNKVDDSTLRKQCINKVVLIEKNEANTSNDINLFPKQKASNILLINTPDWFVDKTNEYNIKRSGWTWNSVLVDYNNDNYLDIYLVNGSNSDIRLTPNYLYINNKWKTFIQSTIENVAYTKPTYVYTHADFDKDWDIDILMKDIEWSIIYLENTLWWNNMLTFNTIVEYNWKEYKNIPNIKYDFYDSNDKLLFSREPKLSWGYNSINVLDILINKMNIDYILITYNDIINKVYIKDIKNTIIIKKEH